MKIRNSNEKLELVESYINDCMIFQTTNKVSRGHCDIYEHSSSEEDGAYLLVQGSAIQLNHHKILVNDFHEALYDVLERKGFDLFYNIKTDNSNEIYALEDFILKRLQDGELSVNYHREVVFSLDYKLGKILDIIISNSEDNDVNISDWRVNEIREILDIDKRDIDDELIIRIIALCESLDSKFGTDSAISIIRDSIDKLDAEDYNKPTITDFEELVDIEAGKYVELKKSRKLKP